MRRFADRAGAGRELADRLNAYQGRPQAVVLGLARGGMPVAFEVARTLGLALDVFVRAAASRALCRQPARPQPCNADGAPTQTLVVAPPPPHRRHPPWPHAPAERGHPVSGSSRTPADGPYDE